MHVLIVEDDRHIAANLYDFLEARGHVVDAAADGLTALHLAVTRAFDAVVLDLGLPGIDGLAFCRKLRQEARRDTPVLMLTARDTLEDKLAGFDAGADDYLVKPFQLKELEARLVALHRRAAGRVAARPVERAGVAYDPAAKQVRLRGEPVRLPPKCIGLLELLIGAPNRVFSRAELERAVWGAEQETSDTLRSHMHTLRRALTDASGACPIETVHGFGYRYADPDAPR